MSFLSEMIAYRRKIVEVEKRVWRLNGRRHELLSLRSSIASRNSQGFVGVIAEYKRCSPRGVVRLDLRIEDYVSMLSKDVVGLSVLTEPFWFSGNYMFVAHAKELADKPVLMKDFVVDEWQIELAHDLGADAVLLIADALSDRELERLYERCRDLKLEALIEVHDRSRAIEVASSYQDALIGVNSRNLRTLEVSLSRALGLIDELRRMSRKLMIVLESGVSSVNDVKLAAAHGANAVLVGTLLMRHPEVSHELTRVRLGTSS